MPRPHKANLWPSKNAGSVVAATKNVHSSKNRTRGSNAPPQNRSPGTLSCETSFEKRKSKNFLCCHGRQKEANMCATTFGPPGLNHYSKNTIVWAHCFAKNMRKHFPSRTNTPRWQHDLVLNLSSNLAIWILYVLGAFFAMDLRIKELDELDTKWEFQLLKPSETIGKPSHSQCIDTSGDGTIHP